MRWLWILVPFLLGQLALAASSPACRISLESADADRSYLVKLARKFRKPEVARFLETVPPYLLEFRPPTIEKLLDPELKPAFGDAPLDPAYQATKQELISSQL